MIYTIKQFIKSGVHLGHYKWECDYRLSYFLLGVRNSIHIINLYYTLFVLKKALYIAYNTSLLNQKIFVVNNAGYNLTFNFGDINHKLVWFINNKWTSGLLSNQKQIYFNNENLFLKFYNLGYDSLLPAYVFASNTKTTGSCIFESIILNIPCSALMDSNMGYYGIFYGIPSNDDNFVSIYLFTRLFLKIYLKAAHDNINSLNMKKSRRKENLNLIKQVKLGLRFDKKLKVRFESKYKRFEQNKKLKRPKWTDMRLEQIKLKDRIVSAWRKKKGVMPEIDMPKMFLKQKTKNRKTKFQYNSKLKNF